MKLPAFQFYPGDWQKDPDLRRCSHAAKGVLMDSLCLMFESEERGVLITGGIPWSDKDLIAAVGGNSDVASASIRELLDKGVLKRREDGAIFSNRMVKDEELRKVRKECGKRGGNPILVNQNPTTGVNQKTEDEDEDEGTLTLRLEAPQPETDEETFVDEIYALYPRKVNPPEAKKAIRRAIQKHTSMLVREKTREYGRLVEEMVPNKADRKYVPHPATWFNAGGFLSDPEEWKVDLRRNSPVPPPAKPPTNFDLRTVIATKTARKDDLRRRFYSETQSLVGGRHLPAGWRDEAARAQYVALKKEITELENKLAEQIA